MTDKLIVEFDRKGLEEVCGKYEKCHKCKQEEEKLIWCNLCYPFKVDFKIKEQNNGR